MKAWVLNEVHGDLVLEERPIPQAGPGQVVVKVTASGLCHSDVGYIQGVIPFLVDLPVVLGHEAAGVVTEVGEGVTNLQVGDGVVGAISAEDAPGVTRDGAYAEYILLTAATAVKLPEGIDWGQAAAATDAGVTSYTGTIVHGKIEAGMKVGIVGLGGLGMTGARICVVTGATVYAAEPRKNVWDAALDGGVAGVVADVSELAGKDLDVVVDFAGFGTTTAGALRAVKKGGRVVQVGLGAAETTYSAFDLVSNAVELKGSTPEGKPEHLQAVIDMIASGDLTITAAPVTFDEIPDGLGRLARGEVTGRLYPTFGEG
jgi:propanol-preferring alcohol dehydrogenase